MRRSYWGGLTAFAWMPVLLLRLALVSELVLAQDPPSLKDLFFDSNGVKIHYVEMGAGVAVILLHGNGGSIQDWVKSGVLQALSKDFRVIAMDARGHGESDKLHDPKAYGREMSLDVLRLMDHLGS